MVSRSIRSGAALLVLVTIALMVFGATVVAAQDGRINSDVYIGGAAIYCVNAAGRASASYAYNGGIEVLDPSGNVLLFVPEAAITAGFAHVAQTGQYATLGVSDDLWYNGQPVAMYLLTSNEFQLNAYDDSGKLVEFQWTDCGLSAAPPPSPNYQGTLNCGPTCRDMTRGTGDGCLPGWDYLKSENRCVFANFD